ncbi:MAG TPA: SDR family oxidoreductase [Planctomycetaceae bacterium]|nr:SDR family oxidoreductase [Planctomycetaceae bacterium]
MTGQQRLLIFGCGYLGERVARRWHALQRPVIAVTRSAERAADWQSRGWLPVVADVGDPSTLRGLPEADTVLFAIGYDRQGSYSQRAIYVDGLAAVLEAMKNRCRRFLYVSSSSVYGQHDGEWVDETSPCEPTQPGGQLCLEAEALVHAAFSAPGTGVVLRFAGIYGPDRLLSRIESLRTGQPLTGRPDAWLNLIHVDDGVSAVIAAAEAAQPSDCYLVNDDEPVPRGDYYRHLAAMVHAPPPTFDETTPSPRGSGGLNKRCRNVRIHKELVPHWRFPTYREGLANALGYPSSAPTGPKSS